MTRIIGMAALMAFVSLELACGGGGRKGDRDLGTEDEDALTDQGELPDKPDFPDGADVPIPTDQGDEGVQPDLDTPPPPDDGAEPDQDEPDQIDVDKPPPPDIELETEDEDLGPAECPCVEDKEAPFCGADGKTYFGDQCAKCAICKNCSGCKGDKQCDKDSDYLKMYGEGPWKGTCESCPCEIEVECDILEKEGLPCPVVPGKVCDLSGATLADICALKDKYKCAAGYWENLQNWGECAVKPECPDQCPPEKWPPNPVCGNDGSTYQHACSAKACPKNPDKPGVAYCGPCNLCADALCAGKEKGCVCGMDGKSYANECEAKQCGKIDVAYNVACCPECNEEPKNEVCGKDTKLYSNKCALACVGVDPCPIGDQVCGKDSKTYFGECEAICRSGGVMYNGPCKGPCDNCDKKFDPVCGEEAKTYANQCFLDCNKGKLFKTGVCDNCAALCGTPDNPSNPPDPVCGTDGVTYPDSCFPVKCTEVTFAPGACK